MDDETQYRLVNQFNHENQGIFVNHPGPENHPRRVNHQALVNQEGAVNQKKMKTSFLLWVPSFFFILLKKKVLFVGFFCRTSLANDGIQPPKTSLVAGVLGHFYHISGSSAENDSKL